MSLRHISSGLNTTLCETEIVAARQSVASNTMEGKNYNHAGKELKKPKPPSSEYQTRYTTKAYPKYGAEHINNPPSNVAVNSIHWGHWTGYPLYVELFKGADDVPINARIDDLTVAKLLNFNTSISYEKAQ